MPKISVILPTYNRAKYLPDAIDSVLNQTYQDFELIIVDDGSTDNTHLAIDGFLKKSTGKIKYILQKNQGASAARNKGLEIASGEYIAFLDSDDIWLPEKLAKQLNILENNKDIDLVYTSGQTIDAYGNKLEKKPAIPIIRIEDFLVGGCIPNMTPLVRKQCFRIIGPFDNTLKAAIDMDIWIRICSKFKCYYLNEVLAIFRKHDTNISANWENIYMGHIVIFKKLSKMIEFNSQKKIIKKRISKETYLLAKFYFTKKMYIKSLTNVLAALINNPLLGKEFWKINDIPTIKVFKICKPYALLLINILSLPLQPKLDKSKYSNEQEHILFYETSSGFGGSASALASTIANLDKQKYNPVVAFTDVGPQIDRFENAELIKLKKYYKEPPNISNLKFIFNFFTIIIPQAIKLLFIIRKKNIAIIHINTNILLGMPAIIAAKISGKPVICHVRETRDIIRREKLFVKFVDKFIVLNKKSYEIYAKYVHRDKISIIFDGLNIDSFLQNQESNFRNEFKLNGCPAIGYLGRIIEGKGQKEFILAAEEILKIKPQVKFLIIGAPKGHDDKYFQEVKDLVNTRNLQNNVVFTDWRTDIKNAISALDIIVQGSTTFPEGLPNTLIEAQASYKPVIATNIAGQSDIVEDGKTGFLVPPGNMKAMAEKIIHLLDNPEIAKKMGEEGRKRAEELFDIKKQIKKIEAIYDELLTS